jgi:DNA-binding transcriptional MerR regulator
MGEQNSYSLADLCDLVEVTPRTVRYYIAEGLLRSPGAGPGAKYDDGHLARLRIIRRLQREHLPLAEIRSRLRALSDDDVREIVASPPQPPAGSAADYVRSVLASRGTAPTRTLGPVDRSRQVPRPVHPLRSLLPTRWAAESPLLTEAPPGPPGEPAAPAAPAAPAVVPPVPENASDDTILALKARAAVREINAEYDTPPYEAAVGQEHADHALPERSQWERISLTPDLELHVRRPLSRLQNRQLARLLQFARGLLEEDMP